MARKRVEDVIDPVTGKPIPDGMQLRENGKFQARKLVNGRRVSKTFATVKLALRWLNETTVDKDRGVFVDRALADRTALKDLLAKYRQEVTQRKRGATQEAGHLLVLERCFIALLKVGKITKADVAKFRDGMIADGYAPGTVVRRMNLMQTVINHAVSEWEIHIPDNPFHRARRPDGADNKRDRIFIDADEAARALAACDGDANKWVGPVVRWALATGMRMGEILSIDKRRDIRGSICIVRGLSGDGSKNGEIREVPLFEDALAVLATAPEGQSNKLFAVDQNILKMRFRRAMARAKVDNLTFHDLRHIATGRLRLRYPNPLDLAKVTGHKSLASLQRYYNLSGQDLLKLALPLPAAEPVHASSGGHGEAHQSPPAPGEGRAAPPLADPART